MSIPVLRPSPEAVEAVRQLAERTLSAEELEAYVSAPMGKDELDEIHALITWFCRRYPDPIDRLRSSRRAYARVIRRSPSPR